MAHKPKHICYLALYRQSLLLLDKHRPSEVPSSSGVLRFLYPMTFCRTGHGRSGETGILCFRPHDVAIVPSSRSPDVLYASSRDCPLRPHLLSPWAWPCPVGREAGQKARGLAGLWKALRPKEHPAGSRLPSDSHLWVCRLDRSHSVSATVQIQARTTSWRQTSASSLLPSYSLNKS